MYPVYFILWVYKSHYTPGLECVRLWQTCAEETVASRVRGPWSLSWWRTRVYDGQDVWKRQVLSGEWSSEWVMNVERSDESTEDELTGQRECRETEMVKLIHRDTYIIRSRVSEFNSLLLPSLKYDWWLSGGKGKTYQVCSVQYRVQQLCTVRCTHIWTDLAVLWIGFCLTGPISLCLDSFLYCVLLCVVCIRRFV